MAAQPLTRSSARPLVILTHAFLPRLVREELKTSARVRIARDPRELERLLKTADGLVTRVSDPVTRELLEHAPRLRAIANFAVGVDNIDFAACRARGIRVVNTPDVLTRATAELTLALLLAAARRIPEGEALCRAGNTFTSANPRSRPSCASSRASCSCRIWEAPRSRRARAWRGSPSAASWPF